MATETDYTVIDHDAITGKAVKRPATPEEIAQREADLAEAAKP